ncbi:hypothetical protein FKW77_006497 [Venturia effusa]|uniref:Uncharacterized protein n=1 Tax=Venturia effusa TaxID=50376 RepID=A0A517L1G5_9PEZI|nr:hypothetical protein FKW77_006497 [Venturia effusa]
MLSPALNRGNPTHALMSRYRSGLATRTPRLDPATSTLQTRTYFGRRHRNEQRRQSAQKHLRNHTYQDEPGPTVETYGREIRDNPSGESPPDPNPPPEPNHKDQVWQQRIDHIRQALEQDPYEALFGNSNRLLGRFGRREWHMDITSFGRNQAERESTWRKQMSSWRIGILGDQASSQQASSDTEPINSTVPMTAARTEPSDKPTTPVAASPAKSSIIETHEYDPISNRMIRKSETGSTQCDQNLDAATKLPAKESISTEPAKQASSATNVPEPVVSTGTVTLQTSLDRYLTSVKTEESNDSMSMQTSLDRYAKESPKARQPSFTMLKEDPIEEQSPKPSMKPVRSEANEPAPTNLRAEYDQYKHERLPPAQYAQDDWLLQEGFIKSSSGKKPSALSGGKDTKKRLKLENDFNEVHLSETVPVKKSMNKSWKLPDLSAQEKESAKTMSQWLGDEWTMEKLRQQELGALGSESSEASDVKKTQTDQDYPDPGTHHVKLRPGSESSKAEEMVAMEEIMNYTLQVAKGNLKNKEVNADKEMKENRGKMVESTSKTSDDHGYEAEKRNEHMKHALKEMARHKSMEPSTQNVRPGQESRSKKAEETAAMNDIMDYNISVARENMENKQANAKKEMAKDRALVAHAMEKARADVALMKYQLQVAKDDMKNQEAAIRKETADYRARIAEAIEEARAHAEILDLNFSRMDHRLRVSHIRRLKDAKEKTQLLIQKLEETRKAEYQAQSVQKQAADLKEIQVAGVELAKLAGEFEAKMATNGSQADETVLAKKDSAQQPAPAQFLGRIPSLAELFGYTPKRDTVAVKLSEDLKLTKAQSSLEKEIAEQKAAMEALGAPRTSGVSAVASNDPASAWPVSDHTEPSKKIDEHDSLTRRLRSIYESKYGKITTSHVQPLVDSCNPNLIIAPPVELEAAAPVPEVASPPLDRSEMRQATEAISAAANAPELEAAAPVPEVASPPLDRSEAREATEAVSTAANAPESVSATVEETSPIITVSQPETKTDTSAVPYTLLAYDSQTQSITRASFTSSPQSSETTIPLTLALKDLHHPAKFLPLVQDLRIKGYEPVHGERNMLILRKMKGVTPDVSEAFVVETVRAEDGPRPQLPSWGAMSGPRRTEEVFSGAQAQRGNKKERKGRKKAWRRAIRRVALGAAAIGGTIYVAGVMAEMTKVVVS